MIAADKLLSRLDKVRRAGPGRWSARCPAHQDRSPSLSIRELDDGRLLLHDFGGCDVHAVLGSLGLSAEDLFPPRENSGHGVKPERRPWSAAQLLNLAAFEASVCVIVTRDILEGREADRARLIEAARRLGNVVEAIHAR